MNRLISKVMFAVSAGAVLALAILPPTAGTIRQQLHFGFGGGIYTLSRPLDDNKAKAFADQNPGDFPLQFAAALQQSSDAHDTNLPNLPRIAALAALIERFPQEPAACAAYLRYAATGGPGRGLEQELLSYRSLDEAKAAREKHLKGASGLSYWETHPDLVAQYARVAERGMTLEPDNGYFRFTRAAALLSRHQDAEAVEMLGRAARSPYWRDYTTAEVQARAALQTAHSGPLHPLQRVANAAAQLYPEYTFQRAVARTFLAQAVLAEQAGDTEYGFQIRHDLARVGARVGHDATTTIGSLTGSATVQSVAGRPGGSAPLKATIADYSRMTPEERGALARSHYSTYLTRIGHADEARWLMEETAREEKARAINRRGLEQSYLGVPSVLWSVVWAAACYLLLTNALWMLLAGGISSWVARGPRVRDAAPLHPATHLALSTVGSAIPLAIGIGSFTVQNSHSLADVAFLVFTVLLFLLVPPTMLWRNPPGKGRETSREQRVTEARRSLKIYGKTVAQALGVCALVAGTLPALVVGPLASFALLQSMTANVGAGPNPTRSAAVFLFLLSLVMGALWLSVLVGSVVASLRRRVPASVGIVLAFRRVALPLTSLFLLTYALAAIQSARVDATTNREIDQSIAHEGRFFASLIGEIWPDFVSEKAK